MTNQTMMTMTTSLSNPDEIMRLALVYLSLGWSVIPAHFPGKYGCSCGRSECKWPGKHPRLHWKKYTQQRATEQEVTEWFSDSYYGSNIGVVTGVVSNLVVVDVDGNDDVTRRRVKSLHLGQTLTSRTGRGGTHYFYHCEEFVKSRGAMLEHVDLKAEGGFVVLPPSLHASGHRYRWLSKTRPVALDVSRLPLSQPLNGDAHWFNESINGVGEGERNTTLCRLSGRYAQKGLTITEANLLISAWNESNRPPLTSQEIASTLKSIYTKHSEENRHLIAWADSLGDT